MSSGIIAKHNNSFSLNRIIVRSALILSIAAVVLIFFISLTVYSSNKLMSIEGSSASNVPSNILPSYSTCSFESFDGQTTLSGWFFKCDDPISTIILVHDTGENRLQFDVDTVDIVEMWLDENYNVFLFDLRNCGESGGDISGYGYLEWQDVLGAIKQVQSISVTTDVILYGVGSGCTACIMAYDSLPETGISESQLSEYSSDILELDFDRSYICGMILDSPAKNSDDYIKPYVAQNEFLGKITQYFVPYAIRVSSGVSSSVNLAAEISRMPIPVCIIYGGHDVFIGADKIEQIVEERDRLNSNITVELMVPGAGYLEAFGTDEDLYTETISEFLSSYFG